MRVAVVTPYYATEPAWLAQCHASVRAQAHPCTHILVSDGGGTPPLPDFQGQLITASHRHADFGDTPRALGSFSAIGQGFDAIAYLDADNWFRPDHVAGLVERLQATGAAVATSRRTLHALDGSVLGSCPESDGERFADTNCLLLGRAAFGLAGQWSLMPPAFHVVDDRWMWSRVLRSKVPRTHRAEPSACYRSGWPHHYRMFGREAPAGAKTWEFSHEAAAAIQALQDFTGKPSPATGDPFTTHGARLRHAHPVLRRHLLQGQRHPPSTSAMPAPLQATTFKQDVLEHGEFSVDWFTHNIPALHAGLIASGQRFERYLEVGSFEGLSAAWMARALQQGSGSPDMTLVDLWAGGPPHGDVERRFDANAARFLGGARVRKIKSDSASALAQLCRAQERFDLVYVDGSHAALDVVVDAALAWSLVRPAGVLLFDDYFWYDATVPRRVLEGVNAFLDLVRGEFKVLGAGYQVMLQKVGGG